jgi:hypothetical protein
MDLFNADFLLSVPVLPVIFLRRLNHQLNKIFAH